MGVKVSQCFKVIYWIEQLPISGILYSYYRTTFYTAPRSGRGLNYIFLSGAPTTVQLMLHRKKYKKNIVLLLCTTVIVMGFLWITPHVQAQGDISRNSSHPVQMGAEKMLGPQSQQAKGEQRVLMVAVRFPYVGPTIPLGEIRRTVVTELDKYVREQSYGSTWIKPDFRGWVKLPDGLSKYRIRHEYGKIDTGKIRKLIEDTMTTIENEVDFSQYQHMLIIPGAAVTGPGTGYGAPCYCANPGMLSGVTKSYHPGYATLKSKGGKTFQGGIFVGVENAHLGMFAHDFFHALGGLHMNRPLVPCLYDHQLQPETARIGSLSHHAVFMGPWDIMSMHYYKRKEPPVGISSFTKIRLGWISPDQVAFVRPGETTCAFLTPLATKGNTLVVKIPLGRGNYYLVENRRPIGFDQILPDSGILILKVISALPSGSGPVRVRNADPDSSNFSHATFKLDYPNRNLFVDEENNIAVIPLWSEEEKQGVLVTTAQKRSEALAAALALQKIQQNRLQINEQKQLLERYHESFKEFEFTNCSRIAKDILDRKLNQ
ncbi:MAG: hypothetical protein QME78_15975 [Thermodesulfobacteriota bacterium]|nr:hypothetical protein [Thermodesulfobacteriota bacterium]